MATQVSDTGSKTRGASDELALIAQRAQAFTNASGTAIALSEGNADEIVCRARSGSSAPDVGTALRVEGSFTGLCIQSGKELRCDDAETDTRVDTTAIRALGIRSMVVTPIKEENRVVGVLAVFAPNAHAFTITHVAVLKTMADQISVFLQKERRAKEEGVHTEPARHEPVRSAMPIAPARPVAAAPSLPPPVVIKPAEPAPASRAAFPVVSRVEPIKPTVVADDITPAPSKKEEKRGEHKSEPRINPASFENAGEEKKSGVSLILMGVVAVALIAVGSTFVYLRMHKHSSPPVAQNVQQPNPVAPQPPATAGTTNTQPLVPSTSSSAPAVKTAVDNAAERRSERTVASRPSVQSAPESRAPETVALSKAPSRIATANQDSSQGDAAPALVVGAGAPGAGALSALAKTSAPAAKPSMLTQSELQPVVVTRKVAPIYPLIARQRRLSGTLVVDALIDKSGKVTNLQLISGPPIFRDAAFDAIKQWQFKPALLNGQAIDQNYQISMQFNPQ